MTAVGILLVAIPVGCFLYAYGVYPALLWLLARTRGGREPGAGAGEPVEWPHVSITLPAYNEEAAIRETLEAVLALDYPPDRLQILVISDASTDGTDRVVRGFSDRGVELLRLEERGGKTRAENEAIPHLRGEIVVNTDASVRLLPGSLKPLVRALRDPTVGVASGRDVSVAAGEVRSNVAESGYVSYEMGVRDLETRVGSIVGASGCLYAVRSDLHNYRLPDHLSRDFAAALTARLHGYRAVSVPEAVCLVPRTHSLRRESRRKTRTMARGLETLWYRRELLNPFRHGLFAWMLSSHKLGRWLVWATLPAGLVGLGLLAVGSETARLLVATAVVVVGLGVFALTWSEKRGLPGAVSLCGYIVGSSTAGALAWWKALRGERKAKWEPTRRTGSSGISSD